MYLLKHICTILSYSLYFANIHCANTGDNNHCMCYEVNNKHGTQIINPESTNFILEGVERGAYYYIIIGVKRVG